VAACSDGAIVASASGFVPAEPMFGRRPSAWEVGQIAARLEHRGVAQKAFSNTKASAASRSRLGRQK
jgi:hypothetical protein